MRHILVETNWVVDVLAPIHRREHAAVALLEDARAGRLVLHVPAFCLQEAARTVQRKFHPRHDSHATRRFILWGEQHGRFNVEEAARLRDVVGRFEESVRRELDHAHLYGRIDEIRSSPGVEVFALDDGMLERLVELGAMGPRLKPLDEAVLAAVLGRSLQLRANGVTKVIFCEKDGDLLPWFKKGQESGTPREPLSTYYREAGVEVISDFLVGELAR